MRLASVLEETHQMIHEDIREIFTDYQQRVEPIDEWSQQVISRIEEYCLRPGKAVRPLLVAVGAALSQGKALAEVLEQPDVRRAMAIVELKHKRIIMADDVSDRDEMRNGKPSMHVGWYHDLDQIPDYHNLGFEKLHHVARSYTEVAGLWLQSISNWLLADAAFSDWQRCALLEVFEAHTYDRTATGWYVIFDQSFEKLTDETSEERLLKGLELVSGEYTFVGPLRIGLSLQKETDQVLDQSLRQYGQAAGILFQITDDIIGAFGDPAVTGKPVGGDFREGKKTLLVQHAYRQGSAQQRQQLQTLIGKDSLSEDEVAQVQQILRDTDALAYAQHRAQEYASQAQAAIAEIKSSAERDMLLELVAYILKRQK